MAQRMPLANLHGLRAGESRTDYDGWSHFRDGEEGLSAALDAAPTSVRERALWLTDGVAVEV